MHGPASASLPLRSSTAARRRRVAVGVVIGLLAAVGLGAAPGSASAASATWQCRASALSLSVAGRPGVEPLVANGNAGSLPGKTFDRSSCASQNGGAPSLDGNLGISGLLSADAAKVTTSITPETGAPKAQSVGATVDIANVGLTVPGLTDLLSVGAVRTRASATCVDGRVAVDGDSVLTDIRLAGVPISLDDLVTQLSNALKPLGFLVQITPNVVTKDGDSVVVQALRIRLLPSSGQNGGLLDLVVGEAKIRANGDVCADDGVIEPNPPTDGICPAGSEPVQQPSTVVLCIIPGTDRYQQVVIGTPNGAPSGGTVIPLTEARRLAAAGQLPKSKCLTGAGLPYVVVGSAGSDRIIGTNGADRILGLAGNDTGSGVSGADCLDGNGGNDRLYGGEGDDRLFGSTGNDGIVGGAGNDKAYGENGRDVIDGGTGDDRLSGGSGNDSLNGNVGNDRLYTGTGRNSAQTGSSTRAGGDHVFTDRKGRAAVNVAVATKGANVTCRSRNDTVRANRKEVTSGRLKGCKRVLQTKTVENEGRRVAR